MLVVDGQEIEVTCHIAPKALLRETNFVFPFLPGGARTAAVAGIESYDTDSCKSWVHGELLILPTCQHALHDLVKIGDEIECEKDRLLKTFIKFAKKFCMMIRDLGFWSDYIDPCSGLPMLSDGCNKTYSEVDGIEVVLQYKTMNCGCCKVLLHPLWGSAVYPASIFTTAPQILVTELLQKEFFSSSH